MYMSVGVMKDYKLKLRKLRASHTLGWPWKPGQKIVLFSFFTPSKNETGDFSLTQKTQK